MTPDTFTMQDFNDSKRDAEQTVRRAIREADGLDEQRKAARIAGQQLYRENNFALDYPDDSTPDDWRDAEERHMR